MTNDEIMNTANAAKCTCKQLDEACEVILADKLTQDQVKEKWPEAHRRISCVDREKLSQSNPDDLVPLNLDRHYVYICKEWCIR